MSPLVKSTSHRTCFVLFLLGIMWVLQTSRLLPVSQATQNFSDPSGAGGYSHRKSHSYIFLFINTCLSKYLFTFYHKTSYSLIHEHWESFNHLVSFQVSFFIQCFNIFIVEIFVSVVWFIPRFLIGDFYFSSIEYKSLIQVPYHQTSLKLLPQSSV